VSRTYLDAITMFDTWTPAVLSLMNSLSAIRRFV
jgi:hypothetical protein